MGSTMVIQKNSKVNSKSRRHNAHQFSDAKLCKRYKFVRHLGHGSYGDVCLAKVLSSVHHKNSKLCLHHPQDLEPDVKFVSIKKMKFHHIEDGKRLLRELRILRLLNGHDYIIRLLDILPPHKDDFNTVYFVYKYSANTDLQQFIFDSQRLSRRHAQQIMYQILCGLKYMHSAGIIHRDLKPANILINTDKGNDIKIKICDLGLARGIYSNSKEGDDVYKEKEDSEERKRYTCVTNHVVTRWYRPPEVILFSQQRQYLPLIDMWGLGCIFSELLTLMASKTRSQYISPLFPGTTCFPMSASRSDCWMDRFDQLNCILSVIGSPTKSEIEKLKDDAAREYLRNKVHVKAMNFQAHFKDANECELRLLKGLLQFDVEKRITVHQALQSEYCAKIRNVEKEKVHSQVVFDFEDVNLNMDTLRSYIMKEISYYND
eukprot:185845_1